MFISSHFITTSHSCSVKCFFYVTHRDRRSISHCSYVLYDSEGPARRRRDMNMCGSFFAIGVVVHERSGLLSNPSAAPRCRGGEVGGTRGKGFQIFRISPKVGGLDSDLGGPVPPDHNSGVSFFPGRRAHPTVVVSGIFGLSEPGRPSRTSITRDRVDHHDLTVIPQIFIRFFRNET